tara:strand:- start:13631 stop:13849 length:219 start_codon:yes stop_codon:yes gene_type:complete
MFFFIKIIQFTLELSRVDLLLHQIVKHREFYSFNYKAFYLFNQQTSTTSMFNICPNFSILLAIGSALVGRPL